MSMTTVEPKPRPAAAPGGVQRRDAHRPPSRLGQWLRYRSWKTLIYAFLLVVGLANIFPFLWMLGTSFKSTSEAATERYRPMPRQKYELVETAPVPESLNARQQSLIKTLTEENQRRREGLDTFIPSRITAGEYHKKHVASGLTPENAQEEVDALVDAGVFRPVLLETETYSVVWKDMQFYVHFLNSLVLTVAVVFITIFSSSMMGYALARVRFPGKMLILGLLIAGTVAPREAVIIPIFRMLVSLELLESLWGMVLWMSGVGIANAFLMAGFFLTLPKEVEEAAAIDGAGKFRTFFDVAFPMARPIVMTVGLLGFLGAWNEFLVPYLCTMSKEDMQPLAVAVFEFQRGHQGFYAFTNAAAAIMVVPVILLFILLQKHVVKSIAVGAVKG